MSLNGKSKEKRIYHMSHYRKSKTNFSQEELDILVDFVKANEVLYNPHHKLYSKTRNRMALWKEIAKTLRKNCKDCMSRWGNTRDYYTRHIKSGVPADRLSDFTRRRLEQLSFLEKIIHTRTKNHSSASPNINMCSAEVFEVSEVDEDEVELIEVKNEVLLEADSEQFWHDESVGSSQSERLLLEFNESQARKFIPAAHAPSFEVNDSKNQQSAQRATSISQLPEPDMFSPPTGSTNRKDSGFVPTKRCQSKQQTSDHIASTTTTSAAAEITQPARLFGLEHYFAGICETVAKFPPIRQAKIKMEISTLVGIAEIEVLEEQERSMCR